MEVLLGILSIKPTIKDTENAKPLRITDGVIELKNVSFSYPSASNLLSSSQQKQRRTVLKQLSLTIKKNQKVAFVGASGSGYWPF